MAKRVKLYEEKRQSWTIPLWVWILGLVVVLTLLFLLFTHRGEPMKRPVVSELVRVPSRLEVAATAATPTQTEPGALPGEDHPNWTAAAV